jgi:hypothetical protein
MRRRGHYPDAFTLIELLVVIAIFKDRKPVTKPKWFAYQ